jgi:DNA-binding MarR family transcriptional regulator
VTNLAILARICQLAILKSMAKQVSRVRQARVGTAEIVPLLVADVFHLAGLFRRRGEEIARLAGRTQAEWQLLSAISDGARTVPQIARRLGFVRQSVQRTADHLESESLVRFVPNPDHKKSTLIELTSGGRAALDRINTAAKASHSEIAGQVDARALIQAERFLRNMCHTLDPTSR